MCGTAFDGFYTPTPDDVPSDSRWPWIVVASGLAVVIPGVVVFSGGATDRNGGAAHPGSETSAHP